MQITIHTMVRAPIDKVWSAWTTPQDIKLWNFASNDWHCPKAAIDLKIGGSFSSRMEAKDGSMGFDFEGTFTEINEHQLIEYAMEDGRKVIIRFEETDGGVQITESFDADDDHSIEEQRNGWQCILDNFQRHVETKFA